MTHSQPQRQQHWCKPIHSCNRNINSSNTERNSRKIERAMSLHMKWWPGAVPCKRSVVQKGALPSRRFYSTLPSTLWPCSYHLHFGQKIQRGAGGRIKESRRWLRCSELEASDRRWIANRAWKTLLGSLGWDPSSEPSLANLNTGKFNFKFHWEHFTWNLGEEPACGTFTSNLALQPPLDILCMKSPPPILHQKWWPFGDGARD